MKKGKFREIWFYIVYGTGLVTLTALGIWLVYQTLVAIDIVLAFLCDHINPVFGFMMVMAIGFYGVFHDVIPRLRKHQAETRR